MINKKHNIQHFKATHKGKCSTCEEQKLLDSMIIKDKEKSIYECIDCKVSKESKTLDDYCDIFKMDDKKEIKIEVGKIKKLIGWALG